LHFCKGEEHRTIFALVHTQESYIELRKESFPFVFLRLEQNLNRYMELYLELNI
jgi:hypothetical protein